MEKSRVLLSFMIVFILLQMVSSKSCKVNNDCPKGQCCLGNDGDRKCSDLQEPGRLCTLSNGSNEFQSGTCYCVPGYRCRKIEEKKAEFCVNEKDLNSAKR
ncbi:hypothetical protein X975_06168, partial [Stegodyphus mimosarum]